MPRLENIDRKSYLTIACMKSMVGCFDDNCEELTIIRKFRDEYVSKEDIEHYYEIAPIIVDAINEAENSDEIWKYIYENVVTHCVTSIKEEEYDYAYNRYKCNVMTLEEIYARPLLTKKLLKVLKNKSYNS